MQLLAQRGDAGRAAPASIGSRSEELLRLACDSGLVVATGDECGNVLDMGRRRRTLSPALRRALLLRDRCCQFPG